jgi:DNA-directed RNA polymerase subunit RPC12/RpoP
MDVASILILAAMTITSVAYVVRPFVSSERAMVADGEDGYSHLQVKRERILERLQELDKYHALGKIQEHDYQAKRTRLVASGAEILHQIDHLWSEDPIEKVVLAHRKDTISKGAKNVSGFNQKPAEMRSSSIACPYCDAPISPDDLFCARCGRRLKAEKGDV